MVQAFQNLSKGAFTNHFKYFKSVGDMVMQHLQQEKEHIYPMSKYTAKAT